MSRFYLIFILVISNMAYPAQKWDLAYCLSIGKQNSKELVIAALQSDVVKAEKQSFGSLFLPDIGYNTSQNYNFGSTIDPSTNTRVSSNISSLNMSLDANISLVDFSSFARQKQLAHQLDYALLEQQELIYQYQYRILELFFQILELQELVKLQQEQFINSKENFNRVTKEVNAGAKPKSDFYDIEYVFTSESISIEQSQNNLFNAKLSLLHLLNYLEVTPDEFEVEYQDSLHDISSEYVFNPMLEKPKMLEKVLLAEQNAIKGSFLPRLSVNYQFGSFYSKVFNSNIAHESSKFSTQFGDNKSHFLGLGFYFPLFQKGQVRRRVNKSKAELELNRATMAQSELVYTQNLQMLEQQIHQSQYLQNQLENNIALAMKSFLTTQIKYENGTADIYSFNGAKNQLLNSQFAKVKNIIYISLLYKKLELLNTNKLS
ncbi:TolC family protein [Myroides sp. LJL115]